MMRIAAMEQIYLIKMAKGYRKKKILVLFPWGSRDLNIFDKCMKKLEFFDYDCINVKFSVEKWRNLATKTIYMYIPYLQTAVKSFSKAKKYDLIFSWSPNPALLLAFFARLLPVKFPPIVSMMFIIPTHKSRLLSKLRLWFTNFSLAKIHTAICFSTNEVTYYAKLFPRHKNKFLFTALGGFPTDLRRLKLNNKNIEDYIFSGGTSNRDYKTLLRAVEGTNLYLKIIGKRMNFKDLNSARNLPNIELLEDIYGQDFVQMMYNSKIVVIPLLNPNISSGQEVLIKAMELGKPIIATNVAGIIDYVIPDYDCVLVPPQDNEQLRYQILELLSNPDKPRTLGENARKSYLKKFTFESFIKRVISLLADILANEK